MTRDEAIQAAEAFVSGKYSHVPRVVSVMHMTVRGDRLFAEHWFRQPGAERWRESAVALDESQFDDADFDGTWAAALDAAGGPRGLAGRWTVFFFMSWDTDALGMPQTLGVRVDPSDGTVAQVTPD